MLASLLPEDTDITCTMDLNPQELKYSLKWLVGINLKHVAVHLHCHLIRKVVSRPAVIKYPATSYYERLMPMHN